MKIATFDDLVDAKRLLYPHSITTSRFLRCRAGTYLARQGLRRGKEYRIQPNPDRWIGDDTYHFRDVAARIAFQIWTSNQDVKRPTVIMPIIRRVMPTIIANEIIGVSPISSPTGSIFALASKWRAVLK